MWGNKGKDRDHVVCDHGVVGMEELLGSGKTLEDVRQHMRRGEVATVNAKPLVRSQVDTFITEVSQDTWIFFPWDMALQYVEPFRGTD